MTVYYAFSKKLDGSAINQGISIPVDVQIILKQC